MIDVEVVYAKPEQQAVIGFQMVKTATVEQAIKVSGILDRFPEIDLTVNKVGIFAKTCALDQVLNQGDRVEIYRPLLHDPKEARRQRAAKA